MEEIYTLLNYIESEMRGKRSSLVPGSVDRRAVLGYTERIRELLSIALSERRIKEEYLKAQQIVELAERERAALIEQNSIVESARQRANEIHKAAVQRANEITAMTKATLKEMLESTCTELGEAQEKIIGALENLKNYRG